MWHGVTTRNKGTVGLPKKLFFYFASFLHLSAFFLVLNGYAFFD
jgi:hypothetical protein